MRTNRLQSRITAGRITLPMVVLVCITCWIITSILLPDSPTEPGNYLLWQWVQELGIPSWGMRTASFVVYAIIGYFLIEINNTFGIIRMRASVQTSLYFALITACPALHLLYAGDVASIAFLISIYLLFKSYQQPRPAGYLFHSFAFIGAGSLVFPPLTFFAPIWLIGAYNFQSLTFRSFCAAVVGWSLPYWFLLGHAFFYGQMELFYAPFRELVSLQPIRFAESFQLWELVTLGYLLIMYLVSGVHCIVSGYKDKIRTRAYLHFLIFLGLCLFVFILLQPQHCMNLLSPLLVVVSILIGHLFVLTSSRLSNGFFICSTVGLILLYVFNIWTLL